MTRNQNLDYDQRLRQLLQAVEIPSFNALARKAGVSVWQVSQLRQGQAEGMRVNALLKLSNALQVPLIELIQTFSQVEEFVVEQQTTLSEIENTESVDQPSALLQQEYERMRSQLIEQRESLGEEFQRSALHTLESWLLQWPTAAYAAQQKPDLPAVRLLPLVRPMEQLLQEWGVEAIASVGTEVPYDPQWHQLLEGTAQVGDLVRVRYTGYRHADKLLFRAKVSLIST